jgi:hypothetical protein
VSLLRLFLGGIGDVPKILRHVGQSPAAVRRQYDQGELAQWWGSPHLVKAAIYVNGFNWY